MTESQLRNLIGQMFFDLDLSTENLGYRPTQANMPKMICFGFNNLTIYEVTSSHCRLKGINDILKNACRRFTSQHREISPATPSAKKRVFSGRNLMQDGMQSGSDKLEFLPALLNSSNHYLKFNHHIASMSQILGELCFAGER